MAVVTLNTPLAEQLSSIMQPKLVEVGWSTGGLDDSALAEYIVLMLVNGKTQEQIASELSNDLLNLGPDDSGALDFSSWLFQQVEILSNAANGSTQPEQFVAQDPDQASQAIPSYSNQQRGRTSRRGSRQSGESGAQDADMGDVMDGLHDGNIPTGPKSMQNKGRGDNKRLIGQLSKAMDRSHDSVLHRVRPQQGTERINSHGRQPPKGPRAGNTRNGFHPGPPTGPSQRPTGNRSVGMMPQISAQQQQQIIAAFEQQAQMMAQLLGPQKAQMFMPHIPGMAINPAFQNRNGPNQRDGAYHNRRQNENSFHPKPNHDVEMGNDDLSSSMEVESSQPHSDSAANTSCKFNLKCTKADCPFAHQSPAAPPGTVIDVTDECPFGAACQNRKCVGRHPSPAQKKSHQSEQDCRFFPNCTNANCTFRHPTMPVCRNGADCPTEGCKFTHVKTMCKFNPCLNPSCFYKHDEGQKRGAFGDKVWTADGDQEKHHVSERKFVENDGGEEELIVPGNQNMGGSQSSMGTEVIT